MGNKKALLIMGGLSLAVLILGIFFTTKTQPRELVGSEAATLEFMGAMEHDWGEIDISGGNVEKTFQIRNTGSDDLVLNNFVTSCMCTEVRMVINGEAGPVFGMHVRSGWDGVLSPGQTADIEVVFDPMAHGPDAVGPITRFISFATNDPNNTKVELKVSGEVVKK